MAGRVASDELTASPAPSQLVQTDLGPIACTDEGQGPAVVAIHGLPGSVRDFRYMAPPLVSHGVRFIRVDLPGFGETPATTQPTPSPHLWPIALNALVDALQLDRPVLVGHSMGGVVATAAVTRDPSAYRGLGLISSIGLRPHTVFRRVPRRSISRLLRAPLAPTLLRPLLQQLFTRGGFRGHPHTTLVRTMHAVAAVSVAEHADAIRKLQLPTLVAWCDDDPLIQADIAGELAAACPNGPRRCFETGGHNPQKYHAQALADAIAELLASD